MHRYSMHIVDGKLAIQWDDETYEQSVERACRQRELSPRCTNASTSGSRTCVSDGRPALPLLKDEIALAGRTDRYPLSLGPGYG
jgi:hypothetical protein